MVANIKETLLTETRIFSEQSVVLLCDFFKRRNMLTLEEEQEVFSKRNISTELANLDIKNLLDVIMLSYHEDSYLDESLLRMIFNYYKKKGELTDIQRNELIAQL